MTFVNSKTAWEDLKEENGNSYTYQVGFTSWVGFGSTTQIKVTEGKVTSRNHESYSDFWDKSNTESSYTETGNDIEKNTYGAAAITIDEMYDLCIADYLSIDTATNSITFSVFENGLLRNCSYFPKNCSDDCSQGVSISAFEWEKHQLLLYCCCLKKLSYIVIHFS